MAWNQSSYMTDKYRPYFREFVIRSIQVCLIFSGWSDDSASCIHLLKGGYLSDIQFISVSLRSMRLLNAKS